MNKIQKQVPIIQRHSIYHRVAIVRRRPCCTPVNWSKCTLCKSSNDCSGNVYNQKNPVKLITVPVGFSDWEQLETQIWELQHKGYNLRLITDQNMPKEIMWAASFSEKNIVQMNLNLMNMKLELDWVSKLMSLSNRCGVYSVLCLNPIVPGVVRTYHVVDILDRLNGLSHFHTNLKFCEIPEEIPVYNGIINFNGYLTSIRFMEKTSQGWKCKSEFIQEFTEKVQLFSEPRKLSLQVCGNESNCTGLKLNKSGGYAH